MPIYQVQLFGKPTWVEMKVVRVEADSELEAKVKAENQYGGESGQAKLKS